MPKPYRSIAAAVTLFFLAPIVAEFLLGDFPATWLPLLIILAPMYGGGALSSASSPAAPAAAGPPSFSSAVAYAIIEEAFTTQSLFNPDIFGLHAHLLSHAWIPSLGIGAWWTLFMLNVHPFWSIGVSIALAEGLFPPPAGLNSSPAGLFPVAPSFSESASSDSERVGNHVPHQPSASSPQSHPAPWLGKIGLSIAAILFTAGCAFNTYYQLHHDPFRATHAQFLVSALVVVAFIAAAFLIPLPAPRRHPSPAPSPPVPPASIIGGRHIPPRRSRHAPAAAMELGRRRLDPRRRLDFPHRSGPLLAMQLMDAASHPQHRSRRRTRLRRARLPSTPRRPLPQMGRPPQPHSLSGPRPRHHRNRRPPHPLRHVAPLPATSSRPVILSESSGSIWMGFEGARRAGVPSDRSSSLGGLFPCSLVPLFPAFPPLPP